MKFPTFLFILLVCSYCSLLESPCGKDKDEFLYNFHKFVKDVNSSDLAYDDQTWEDYDIKFKKFTNGKPVFGIALKALCKTSQPRCSATKSRPVTRLRNEVVAGIGKYADLATRDQRGRRFQQQSYCWGSASSGFPIPLRS